MSDVTPRFPVRDSRLIAAGLTIALVVGGSYGAQRVVLRLVRDQPANVVPTLLTQLVPWMVWVALLPVLARLCVRAPLVANMGTVVTYVGAAILATLVHTALALVPIGVVTEWTTVNLPAWVGYQQLLLNRGVAGLTEFALIVTLLHAVLYHVRSTDDAHTRRTLEKSLAEAELRALRMQLEPHFLFNTLNAISAYVRADPATAESMLRHLSAVLRAVLESGRSAMTTIRDEMALVEAYLAIHQVRMGDRLMVQLQVAEDVDEMVIPTLLLQPLVENAIVHGAARRAGAVTVAVSAVGTDDGIQLTVSDHGTQATDAVSRDATTSTRIGLANTVARLEHVYGADHRLTADFGAVGSTVTITIPRRPVVAA